MPSACLDDYSVMRRPRDSYTACAINQETMGLNQSARIFHHLHETVEQVRRVMRAGAGLRVVLHRIDRQVAMAQALARVVFQFDVLYFAVLRYGIGIHREAMILRRDFDTACYQVFHRLIAAVMS